MSGFSSPVTDNDPNIVGGAPADAVYLTLSLDASLTNERALVDDGTTVQLADGGPGSVATLSVRDNGVTNAKLTDMAASTIKGRAVGAGPGDPTDLTAAQAVAVLASGSGGGTSNFLRADGTWATPPGGGGGGGSGNSFFPSGW